MFRVCVYVCESNYYMSTHILFYTHLSSEPDSVFCQEHFVIYLQ